MTKIELQEYARRIAAGATPARKDVQQFMKAWLAQGSPEAGSVSVPEPVLSGAPRTDGLITAARVYLEKPPVAVPVNVRLEFGKIMLPLECNRYYTVEEALTLSAAIISLVADVV